MSVLTPIASEKRTFRDGRKVPRADICGAANGIVIRSPFGERAKMTKQSKWRGYYFNASIFALASVANAQFGKRMR
jgi:hypothetical protein